MVNKKSITRLDGVNYTEKVLAKLCDKTFLKLWAYPNPYKKISDELCDVLVVFDGHIFIFSVKEIKFNEDKDIQVSWNRWKRKAVDESLKQTSRAENWIKSHPDKIYLDAKCETKIPINIDPNNCKVHKIIVAHGAEKACKDASSDNVAGSLAISYSDDVFPDSKVGFDLPFFVNLPRQGICHLFDSYNLDIMLGELDTVRDFIWYLEAKEEAIQKYKLLSYCGEEDLLAHYLQNFNEKTKNHYIGVIKEEADIIHVAEGEWDAFSKSDTYTRKKKADKPSYLWDELLQVTFQNAFDGMLLGDNDIFNNQSALVEMSKEPRFMRRELSKAMINSIKKFPDFKEGMGRNLSSYPSYYPDIRYVFLQLTQPKERDCDKEYRPLRQKMLHIACGIEKTKRPHLKKVAGIAIDAQKYSEGNSEDFILLDCNNWSQKDADYFIKENKLFNFFETDSMEIKAQRSYEFPPKQSKQTKSSKIGRNDPCPCGSNKKYKKCCLS